MSYEYGMRGFPAVGNGLGGLPRRRCAAASPLVEEDPYFYAVALLLHGDGLNGATSFTDATRKHTITANGNVKLSSDKAKFGDTSFYFDGAGSYLSIDSSSDFAFGLGDFTIEMWVCADHPYNGGTGEPVMLFDPREAGTTNPGPILIIGSSKFLYTNSNTYHISGTTYPVPGIWYHLALSRVSNVTRMFVNGFQEGVSYTDNYNNLVGTNKRPLIGVNAWGPPAGSYKGWLDEIRITKGIGRYTSNFTPPTAPFPDQ